MKYCISIWGGIAQTHIEKLFRLQKRCLRILFGDKEKLNEISYCKEHTKPIFQNYEILTIHNIYTYQTSIEITKLLKFRTPTSIHTFNKGKLKYSNSPKIFILLCISIS